MQYQEKRTVRIMPFFMITRYNDSQKCAPHGVNQIFLYTLQDSAPLVPFVRDCVTQVWLPGCPCWVACAYSVVPVPDSVPFVL